VLALVPVAAQRAGASHTPDPAKVVLAGSFQSELGCSGDWQPECDATALTYDAADGVWQASFTVPAGNYEYKAALNGGWAENYGAGGVPGGANIPLMLGADTTVKLFYSHETHWVTDDVNSVIATVPGSFQSELGCSGDWQPDCLRSWLQDLDGDGTYSFETTAIPAGSYEAKVTIDQRWDENYGQGGVQNGPNIPFSVTRTGQPVTFSYDATSHVLTIRAGHAPDNNVEWAGLRHDSRDTLYRTPVGAVPAGTPVTIRFRTFHNDVTEVKLRVYDLNAGGQTLVPMTPAATDVSCYEAGLDGDTCDYWSATLPNTMPNNYWYRFIVTDGTDTDYYADNTAALDGGLGAATDDAVDNSYALMGYDPAFEAPTWAKGAVIYQIFPDRFRNGRSNNDPRTGDVRYDDPVLRLPWNTLPEGYCRNYADGATNCPWRFDDTPPDWSPTKEGPRGRDYMGGDLKGIDQQLDYLQSLGVNTIYLNPIFDAGSNHSYDTQDYYRIDPYFGTQKDFDNLVKHMRERGMRLILDGVFNHLSSDSPFFDRYGHYTSLGACESADSPYRSWFTFNVVPGATAKSEAAPCAPNAGETLWTTYVGWFGFDSIPVIDKTLPEVWEYFLTSDDAVAKHWLEAGAGGWRMDVSGDPSFPSGYWETFRDVTKTVDADAFLISETWQKDSTLLRMLRGDRFDTTMNYRVRDAVIGLLAPGPFDSKGFADSGRVITPSEFVNRIASIQEDYPEAAFATAMNLLDSHDTERLRWTLTPGTETRADKEMNAANVAEGKRRQQLASLVQFTLPGAPTVFYGDEIAQTGDDDPDDRRTYPWTPRDGQRDTAMLTHYQTLGTARHALPVLTDGDLRMLLADDTAGTVAYGRATGDAAAVVVLNRTGDPVTVDVPVAGYLTDGTALTQRYAVGTGSLSATVTNGVLPVLVEPMSGVLLAATGIDLMPPEAPTGLAVTGEGNAQVSVQWNAVPGAAGYDVYASPVPGGGYVKQNAAPVTGTAFTVTGLTNGQPVYVVVKALDAAGNASAPSHEVTAVPRLAIGWANLQWPPTLNHTISAVNRTGTVYGQVWIDGATNLPGPTPTLRAQAGFGPAGSDPDGNPDWVWVDATFNTNAGNNDEFQASFLPESTGTFDYAYRYTTTGGLEWLYADLDGTSNGYSPEQAGKLTVSSSGDTTPPAAPTGLMVVSASPAGVGLTWDPVVGDPSLYGYEVLRSSAAGGPYTQITRVTAASYTDTAVVEAATYYYVVRALDLSFNRSGNSAEVSAKAELRTVSLVFNVTVPATTDATGKSVYIAGFLDRLDGGLPQWNPGGVSLTRADATTWTWTATGKEGTQIEYKYTLGSWDFVEKGAACDEIGNRQLTLTYGATGTQTVNDTVLNWRNVSPCGN
jgi:glycosidase